MAQPSMPMLGIRTRRLFTTWYVEHMPTVTGDPYQLLTRPEVAALLRCSLPTVTNLTRSGRLHSTRVGGRCLVPRASLDAYLRGEPKALDDGNWPPTPAMFTDEGEVRC